MIKFRKENMKFIIFGRNKSNPITLLRKSSEVKSFSYTIDFKIRFPYKWNDVELRHMFMPITLSLFMFGVRTSNTIEVPVSMDITIDDGSIIKGVFLVSKPFTLKKKNKNNVEYESRKITIVSDKELILVDSIERHSNIDSSYELFDIKINKN